MRNILKEMGVLDHITCILRKLYVGQEATGHETTDCFQIGQQEGCILSPCLFNLHAEYILWNARLYDSQAGIKIAGEISTTSDMQMIPLLMAESEEELKSLLMRMKEESEKAGLKLNIKNTKIMASNPIT